MRRTLAAALLALLVVVAGCTAPSAPEATPTAGPTTDSTPAGTATTTTASGTPTAETPTDSAGGEMAAAYGVDADLTIDRVERLLDVTITHPRVIVSGERIAAAESDYSRSLSTDPFLAAFGLASDANGSFQVAGYVGNEREVVLSPNLTARGAESTLAHEVVHVVQRQRDWRPRWNGTTLAGYWGTEGREVRYVRRLVTEGTAQYVEYAYGAASMGASPVEQRLSLLTKRYGTLDGPSRLTWAPYYHGLTYVAETAGNTTGIAGLFGRTPLTTEQYLHGETPATEPLVPLSVQVGAPASQHRGPQGELFTRIALQQKLPDKTATAAAAGWGNDRLVAVESGDLSGQIWVTRWDTPADAAEFTSAIETFAAVQIEPLVAYDVRRPARDIVVVTLGPPALADRTRVGADGGTVRIAVRGNATG